MPSARRLLGIDRSGPPPARTRRGEPLRPWTIPNGIDYVRLALIPVFLIVALSSRHGRSTAAVILYAVIGWTDYLDGFTARLTGQYSRLGTFLDPSIDRLLVVSGMAVAYRFSLLPRWALIVVIVREVATVILTRLAYNRGVELPVNWFGRLGVAPALGAPFFAMAGAHTVALVMLYVGMTLGLVATAVYIRTGARARKLSS